LRGACEIGSHGDFRLADANQFFLAGFAPCFGFFAFLSFRWLLFPFPIVAFPLQSVQIRNRSFCYGL